MNTTTIEERFEQAKRCVEASFNFVKVNYEYGFDDYNDFKGFLNICDAHANTCNYLCDALIPIFPCIQKKRNRLYKELEEYCDHTIYEINRYLQEYSESENNVIKTQINND